MPHSLDRVNHTLLEELSQDGRRTVRALAGSVGLSEPAVRERLNSLERHGVITGYRVVLDPDAVGAGTAAFVSLRFAGGAEVKSALNEALRQEGCVLEVHEVAGDDCYLLKVRVDSTTALADALDRLRAMPHITSTSSTIVLRTLLERPVAI
jgi:Lrp/AsnC family leucine-responsive transcriptional regulator